MMFDNLTGSSCLKNTNDVFSQALMDPKSRNCFMESGEGENLEKCSICLGTLASAAFFIINLTNFIVAVLDPKRLFLISRL